MSMHDLVANVIGGVNPMMLCQWYKNIGFVSGTDGSVVPSYNAPAPVTCQVQALSSSDRKALNDMGVSGITRKVWCDAQLTGIDREAGLGGDRLYLPDSTTWLVVQVVESWPDWCSAILQKQVA